MTLITIYALLKQNTFTSAWVVHNENFDLYTFKLFKMIIKPITLI